jgi:hypothetical protein
MKKITVCFSKPINHPFPIGSYLIRCYLGTGYSHTSYHFEAPKYDCTMVYEAVGSGIRFIEKQNWLKHAQIMKSITIEVPDEIYHKMMDVCIKKAGLSYGYMQNLGIVIANIFNLEHNPFPAHENCSEILAEILEEAGYKFNKSYDLVTPKDIETAITPL